MSRLLSFPGDRAAGRARGQALFLGLWVAAWAAGCAPGGGPDGSETSATGSARAPLEEWVYHGLLFPSDGGSYDHFGGSAALLDGGALVSTEVEGAVYWFERDGSTWTQRAKLSAPDKEKGDDFGRSIAVSGDTAVIGAPGGPSESKRGAAYVLVRDGETWTVQAKLVAAGGAPGDMFGHSVAVSGDVAVVGALRSQEYGASSGSVHVFVRDGTTWTEQVKLTASDEDAGYNFGISVAISGDLLLAGAIGAGGELTGAAYAFVRNGSIWTEEARLTAPDTAPGDAFGRSVALHGETALVGAPLADYGEVDAGAAYVLSRNGGQWSLEVKLAGDGGAQNEHVGGNVALAPDLAVVGAAGHDSSGDDAGAAYVFRRIDGVWKREVELVPAEGAEGFHFGSCVAASGRTVLASAPGDDWLGADSGAAYLFELQTKSRDPCAGALPCASEPCADTACCGTGCSAGSGSGGGAGSSGAEPPSGERSYYSCSAGSVEARFSPALMVVWMAIAVTARRRRLRARGRL